MRNTPEESERNGMFDGDERERDEIGQMREAPKENKKVEKSADYRERCHVVT